MFDDGHQARNIGRAGLRSERKRKILDRAKRLCIEDRSLPMDGAETTEAYARRREGWTMATAHDVAAYILRQQGAMSAMKLQKIVYYAQAWHLVWDEEKLFSDPIEAWANGPVVYALFDRPRGRFEVSPPWSAGNPENLTQDERETIDAVLFSYGSLSGRQLSHLTHNEAPWREAREGLGPTDRSRRPISLDKMHQFYSALDADQEAQPVEEIDWARQDAAS